MIDPAALESHLPDSPDDAAYLVFADWLHGHDHPWGELIALQHGAARATGDAQVRLAAAADAHLARHRAILLGEVPADAVLVWRAGFVEAATLPLPAEPAAIARAVRALRSAPVTRHLATLALAPQPATFVTTRSAEASTMNIVDPWTDWDALGPALARVPAVELGTVDHPTNAYIRMPDFDDVSRWLRDVTRLALVGSGRAGSGPLDLPTTRDLAVRFAHARRDELAPLTRLRAPQLERFTLGLGAATDCILDDVHPPGDHLDADPERLRYPETYDADDLAALEASHVRAQNVSIDVVRDVISAIPPSVHELDFSSSALSGNLLATIVRHPRVRGLRRLALSRCTLADAVAPILVDNAADLAAIGAIDLSCNAFSKQGQDAIRRALPNAILDEQGRVLPALFMRYVGTME